MMKTEDKQIIIDFLHSQNMGGRYNLVIEDPKFMDGLLEAIEYATADAKILSFIAGEERQRRLRD